MPLMQFIWNHPRRNIGHFVQLHAPKTVKSYMAHHESWAKDSADEKMDAPFSAIVTVCFALR